MFRIILRKGPWQETHLANVEKAFGKNLSVVSEIGDYTIYDASYTGYISCALLKVIAEECDDVIIA